MARPELQTPKAWIREMSTNGVSTRPIPHETDLTDPLYRDPEAMKPERVALAGIFALRAYQRAKPLWRETVNGFSLPKTSEIPTLDHLKKKNVIVGSVFLQTMVHSALVDEHHVLSQSKGTNPNALKAYERLESILDPFEVLREDKSLDVETDIGSRHIPYASAVTYELYTGIPALPRFMHDLMATTITTYEASYGEEPDKETVFRIMGNSFESYVTPRASLHQLDGLRLITWEKNPKNNSAALEDDKVVLSDGAKKVIQNGKVSLGPHRANRTRCAFYINPAEANAYLDQPAEYDNPLRDAFDTHMELLAA